MTGNPIDPNKDPFAWMVREMDLNRQAYFNKCPQERGLKPWEAANFAAQKPQIRRRKL